MSPSPQHRNAVVMPADGTESSRLSSSREDTSLFHEIHETVRRLLQHIVFLFLLTLRLYILPLLYLSHKLAVRDDPWYPATWNFLLHPGRTLAQCTRCRKRDGSVTIVETWHNVRDGFCAPLRIFKTLYSLGKIITEDPNTMQPSSLPLSDAAPDSAIDVQSEHDGPLRLCNPDSPDSQLDVPASTSQIYHAALLNGSTLDNILAAFETDRTLAAPRREPVPSHQSPVPVSNNEREAMLDLCRGHHRRSSSIQTTPERMLMPPKATENSASCPARISKEHIQKEPKTPIQKSNEPQVKVRLNDEGEDPAIRSSAGSSASCHGRHASGGPSRDKCVNSTTLKRCPTFVRRQTQSRLQTRPDRQSLAVLEERGAMTSPALGLGSPTKHARLRRKVKVYQDTGKALDA
ncbi:uncharacterized protein Z518_07533 [Rhinocladiella mackenziei CBS 650.93]|uniref:Rhinocladiella mackenziei CBS 650.93 unplaced genomic scaffold supercont1.5, whole genome shotgun sequence n=1 Tax=Rhinocladiella mackenziei CBS 650.93 TaxID=1442369 RepID=A0A0D2J4R2_9EURO|nr:uncharacterized protein Z518_07533 [Rhinocladiella mackenziei CBS 650.93]KIX03980.1 hypothetical protein Z518_07533 [Rhinocladiella mackenziei CBS 650.93]